MFNLNKIKLLLTSHTSWLLGESLWNGLWPNRNIYNNCGGCSKGGWKYHGGKLIRKNITYTTVFLSSIDQVVSWLNSLRYYYIIYDLFSNSMQLKLIRIGTGKSDHFDKMCISVLVYGCQKNLKLEK